MALERTLFAWLWGSSHSLGSGGRQWAVRVEKAQFDDFFGHHARSSSRCSALALLATTWTARAGPLYRPDRREGYQVGCSRCIAVLSGSWSNSCTAAGSAIFLWNALLDTASWSSSRCAPRLDRARLIATADGRPCLVTAPPPGSRCTPLYACALLLTRRLGNSPRCWLSWPALRASSVLWPWRRRHRERGAAPTGLCGERPLRAVSLAVPVAWRVTASRSSAELGQGASCPLARSATYRLYVTKRYDPERPTPLVISMHGGGSGGRSDEMSVEHRGR